MCLPLKHQGRSASLWLNMLNHDIYIAKDNIPVDVTILRMRVGP